MGAGQGKWTCQVCRGWNEPGSRKCDVCGAHAREAFLEVESTGGSAIVEGFKRFFRKTAQVAGVIVTIYAGLALLEGAYDYFYGPNNVATVECRDNSIHIRECHHLTASVFVSDSIVIYENGVVIHRTGLFSHRRIELPSSKIDRIKIARNAVGKALAVDQSRIFAAPYRIALRTEDQMALIYHCLQRFSLAYTIEYES
jgi:hypothetical protein